MTDRPDLIENLGEEGCIRAAKIAKLNDNVRLNMLRMHPRFTVLFMGALANELQNADVLTGLEVQTAVAAKIGAAGPFTVENDPHGERDFGSFELKKPGFNEAGEKIFWKIDYYDLEKENGSPDPTDIRVTHRVMTIFYASDY